MRQAGVRKRFVNWIELGFDTENNKTHCQIRGPLKNAQAELAKTTRDNCLLLSRAANIGAESISALFQWFRVKSVVQNLSSQSFQSWARKYISANRDFKSNVLKLLRDADTGIDDVEIEGLVIKSRNPESGELPIHHSYEVTTRHRLDGNGDFVEFDLERDESNGTQRLFYLAGPVLAVLDQGSLLVLDELDCSLHPLLSRKIIAMFQSPSLIKKEHSLFLRRMIRR